MNTTATHIHQQLSQHPTLVHIQQQTSGQSIVTQGQHISSQTLAQVQSQPVQVSLAQASGLTSSQSVTGQSMQIPTLTTVQAVQAITNPNSVSLNVSNQVPQSVPQVPPFPTISTGAPAPATMDQEFQQIIMNNPLFRSQLPTLFNAAALQQVTQQASQHHLNQVNNQNITQVTVDSANNPSPTTITTTVQSQSQIQNSNHNDQCSPTNRSTPSRGTDKDASPQPSTPHNSHPQPSATPTPTQSQSQQVVVTQSQSTHENQQLIQAVARQAVLLQQHQANTLIR
jgi:phosphohistidine swiveling domain-containing protein